MNADNALQDNLSSNLVPMAQVEMSDPDQSWYSRKENNNEHKWNWSVV